MPDAHFSVLLVHWVGSFLRDVANKIIKCIDHDADRILLMERVMDMRYQPQPVHGVDNVWNTYFALSKGLANVIVVKTCPPDSQPLC